MNEREARALYSDIREEAPRIKAEVYEIGNGEHVVIANDIWLWSHADWWANRAKIQGKPAPLAV